MKTLVYYNPRLDEIYLRHIPGKFYWAYEDDGSEGYVLDWTYLCEKNFVLLGEL
jgi:hypothetical protein